jgi:hypothetical protein
MTSHRRALRTACLLLAGASLTQLGTCLFQMAAPVASLLQSFGLTYLAGVVVP